MGDIRQAFGRAVRKQRKALGLSQEELADRADLHRTYLSMIERGKKSMSLVRMERLVTALKLSLPDLFKRVERLR